MGMLPDDDEAKTESITNFSTAIRTKLVNLPMTRTHTIYNTGNFREP